MLKIQTLQQRFVVYMLLPVAFLLCIMGAVGFLYARNAILKQWEEAAILKLQRAAHHVDMRLERPKEWVDLYLKLMEDDQRPMAGGIDILRELADSPGVVAVYRNGQRLSDAAGRDTHGFRSGGMGRMGAQMGRAMGPMGRGREFTVTEPHYNPDTDNRTVSLMTRAVSDNPEDDVEIEVVLDFDYLLQDMPFARWWRSQKTFLIDRAGHIFVSTTDTERKQIGETGDPVEVETLAALQKSDSGTLRGKGRPPQEISGYYRLQEAPWYLAVFAPGEEILKPILRFRNYYFLTLGGFVLVILLLIRRVAGQVALSVNQLSVAAGDIARGRFDLALPERTGDEIGALTRSFNTMAAQLKERVHLLQSLDLAKEVQQNLLPARAPDFPGLDVAGRSIYCEETGGDYFDYLTDGDALPLVIGDVAGHGIPSALLMSSVRAGLRQRYDDGGDIGPVISDVNRQIALDVGDSGRFMTLLALVVDRAQGEIRWVRAGHDPGMLYRRGQDRFEDLAGPGMALGVDPAWAYRAQKTSGLQPGDIILLGTDGVWEALDCEGIMFGKAKVRDILRDQRDQPAEAILGALFDAVAAHACETKLADDMTLIVAKIVSTEE